MIRKLFITLAVLCLVGNTAHAGTIDPRTPDSKHLKYGEDFIYVGRVCALGEDGKLGVGSCVAVRPRVVLTAAHVVHDSVFTHIHINGKEIAVSKVITPDEFNYGGKLGGDIAICLLKEDIGLEFYPDLYEKNDEIGKVVSISGFGVHGTFIGGGIKSDNNRRAGSNVIDSITEDLLIATPGGAKRTALEFCITPGDSGGGLFIDNKLAGINCCVFHTKGEGEALGKYGHEAAHTRISVHKKWIEEQIELHECGFYGNEHVVEPAGLAKPE